MSKQTKTKKSKPATKKVSKAPTKSVAKQAAPVKATKVAKGGSKKPFVAAICALSVAAAGLGVGGFFLGKSLAGGNGGGGGGGDTPTPQPGDVTVTDITIGGDIKDASVVVTDKAVIGQDYKTNLIIIDKPTSNSEKYKLPDTLRKVSYKIGNKETEISDYEYDILSDDNATLFIDKKYVLGQIDIKLDLVPIERVVIEAYQGIDTNHCTIWDNKHEHKLSQEATKIALDKYDDKYSYTFNIDIESGYTLVEDDITISDKEGTPLTSFGMTYSDGKLIVTSEKFDAIEGIVVEAIARQPEMPIMAFVSAASGCTVYYDSEEDPCQGLTPVYPSSETNEVVFNFEIDEEHYLLPESSGGIFIEPTDKSVTILHELTQSDDGHYKLTLTGVTTDFYLHIQAEAVPTDCPILFIGQKTLDEYFDWGAPQPFIAMDSAIGKTEFEAGALPLKELYAETDFAISITGTKNVSSCTFYPKQSGHFKLNFSAALEISDRFTLNLIPVSTKPVLTTNSTEIALFDKEGQPKDEIDLQGPGKETVFNIRFTSTEHAPINMYNFSFVGFEYLDHYINVDPVLSIDGFYTVSVYLGTTYKMNNMVLQVALPEVTTYTATFGTMENCTVRYADNVIAPDSEVVVYPDPTDNNNVKFNIGMEPGYAVFAEDVEIQGEGTSFDSYEVWGDGTLYITNVHGDFAITSIKAKLAYKTIDTYSGVPGGIEISQKSGPISTDPSNPTQVEYSIYGYNEFNIKNNLGNTYDIDSEWALVCEDANGNSAEVYGTYRQEQGILTFALDDDESHSILASATKVKMMPKLIEKTQKVAKATIIASQTGTISFCGKEYESGSVIEIYNSTAYVYVNAKNPPTVAIDGTTTATRTVETLGESHDFGYLITITGISANDTFNIKINQ